MASHKMATKKHNFSEKWEEFQTNAIDTLIQFLNEESDDINRVHNVETKMVFTNKEFMRLYNIIYNLCVVPKGNFSKLLYSKYVEAISKYLIDRVLPDVGDFTGSELLKKLATYWDNHINIFVKWLGKCFKYLDQHYVRQFSLEPVLTKGQTLFKANVFLSIKLNVMQAIIYELEQEREGECIDDLSLKQVIQMIIKFRENSNDDESDFYKELEEL